MNPPLSTQPAIEVSGQFLPLDGNGHGFVEKNWKASLERIGLRRIEDFFSVTGQPLSKPGLGKRYRAQIECAHNDKSCLVFLKRYEGETLRNLSQRWWEDGDRSAIALREVRVAAALEKIRIATFKPLAWGWQGDWGTRQKSFLVMSQVPGKSMERWLETNPFAPTRAGWERKKRLVKELALLARRFHEAGWFHRDFYLCHIFISEAGEDFQLALVDLARVFRPKWRGERWRLKDLAQLNYSALRKDFSRAMRLRFAKIYFGCDRCTVSQKKFLRKIVRKTEAIARRDQLRNKSGPEHERNLI